MHEDMSSNPQIPHKKLHKVCMCLWTIGLLTTSLVLATQWECPVWKELGRKRQTGTPEDVLLWLLSYAWAHRPLSMHECICMCAPMYAHMCTHTHTDSWRLQIYRYRKSLCENTVLAVTLRSTRGVAEKDILILTSVVVVHQAFLFLLNWIESCSTRGENASSLAFI